MIMVRNNIAFRKESSIAVSKFKQHEHFILAEMTEGKTEFNRTSKEIMLLKFRLWSKWLNDIEDMIAFLPIDEIGKADVENILYTMGGVDCKYSISIHDNPHLFEPKQSACWLEVHEMTAYEYLVAEVTSIIGKSKVDGFDIIVTAIIEAMLMGMYELWEISLLRDDTRSNKLAYTNMSHHCFDKKKTCYLGVRAKIYSKFYDVNEFSIENYSSGNVEINEFVFTELLKSGITLVLKRDEE